MKLKITNKELKNNEVYSVGYCGLQDLLSYESPIAYNKGVYGWNYDVYKINNVYICTGYRNLQGIRIPYDVCQKYERLSEEISYNDGLGIASKRRLIDKLIKEIRSIKQWKRLKT